MNKEMIYNTVTESGLKMTFILRNNLIHCSVTGDTVFLYTSNNNLCLQDFLMRIDSQHKYKKIITKHFMKYYNEFIKQLNYYFC